MKTTAEAEGPGSMARREFLRNSMLAGSGILVASRLLTAGSDEAMASTPQRTPQSSASNTVAVRLRVNGTVYVRGNRAVVVDPKTGEQKSQFKNSRRNTQERIDSGRWEPIE